MGLTLKRLVDGLRAVFTVIFHEKHEIREFEKDPIREDCVGVMAIWLQSFGDIVAGGFGEFQMSSSKK